MSAPTSPPAPRSRLTPPRLLGAVAFAAVGFVAVWQGFGLAGFGTDAHAPRVLAVVAPLFVCGLVLVWPRWSPLRAVVAVVGLVGAGAAWWLVPTSNFKSAMPLRDAVQWRDGYKEQLATPKIEDVERSEGHRGVKQLADQYPSLCKELSADYERWATGVTDELVARYRKTPLDDFKSFAALDAPTETITRAHPASAERLDAARRQWLSNALHAKTHELEKLKPGDWAGFNNTAPGRRAFADALPDTRDALLRAEWEWVDSSVESIVANKLAPKAGEAPPTREFWKQTHWDVLALKSLDPEENRFPMARRRLFKVAHDAAVAEALAHFKADRFDRAFGVVRTHNVDWSATATVLGETESKALAELRGTYAFFDALASKSAKPAEPLETAPPPRTKP